MEVRQPAPGLHSSKARYRHARLTGLGALTGDSPFALRFLHDNPSVFQPFPHGHLDLGRDGDALAFLQLSHCFEECDIDAEGG